MKYKPVEWEKIAEDLYQTKAPYFLFFIEKLYNEWYLYSCCGRSYGSFKTLQDAQNYFMNM